MPTETDHKPRQADFFSICRNCRNGCCTGARPPLTSKRKKLIQKFLTTNEILRDNPFEDKEYAFPKETEEGHCIFLDKTTTKCLIHPVKPETCVAGPITFDINKTTGKIEWFLKMDKICSLSGHLYRDKEAFEKHVKSAKREIRRLVRDLNANALRSILTIEEPETFKVGEDDLSAKILAKLKP